MESTTVYTFTPVWDILLPFVKTQMEVTQSGVNEIAKVPRRRQ